MHENYPGFASGPDAKRTTDTSGALLSLAMIGTAVKDGLIELDAPLLDYTPLAVEIFGKDTTVTARHILQQTHGGAVEENQRANEPGQARPRTLAPPEVTYPPVVYDTPWRESKKVPGAGSWYSFVRNSCPLGPTVW